MAKMLVIGVRSYLRHKRPLRFLKRLDEQLKRVVIFSEEHNAYVICEDKASSYIEDYICSMKDYNKHIETNDDFNEFMEVVQENILQYGMYIANLYGISSYLNLFSN